MATGGGHGISTGFSHVQGAIDIDLGKFNKTQLYLDDNLVTVGAANVLADFAETLYKAGKEIRKQVLSLRQSRPLSKQHADVCHQSDRKLPMRKCHRRHHRRGRGTDAGAARPDDRLAAVRSDGDAEWRHRDGEQDGEPGPLLGHPRRRRQLWHHHRSDVRGLRRDQQRPAHQRRLCVWARVCARGVRGHEPLGLGRRLPERDVHVRHPRRQLDDSIGKYTSPDSIRQNSPVDSSLLAAASPSSRSASTTSAPTRPRSRTSRRSWT